MSTLDFDDCFRRLIDHEGGYVDNNSDPGGETKFGVSKRAYPDLDIKNLSIEQAKAIYKRDYWDRAKCDLLPSVVAFQVFDTAVNSGIGQSIRFLQRAAGVADDGQVGPMTLAAINRLDPEQLAARFNGHRLEFLTKLSTWDVFGKGLARRIAKNLMEL
jgi:lysozyme family protein